MMIVTVDLDGPGPETYSSWQQVLVLHSVSINNIMPCIAHPM